MTNQSPEQLRDLAAMSKNRAAMLMKDGHDELCKKFTDSGKRRDYLTGLAFSFAAVEHALTQAAKAEEQIAAIKALHEKYKSTFLPTHGFARELDNILAGSN